MDFFGIGPMELLLIIIIAFIVFGPNKLPEIGRGLGKAVREFRKYSSSLTRDFKDEFEKELKSPPDQQSKSARATEEILSDRNAASHKTEAIQRRNTDES